MGQSYMAPFFKSTELSEISDKDAEKDVLEEYPPGLEKKLLYACQLPGLTSSLLKDVLVDRSIFTSFRCSVYSMLYLYLTESILVWPASLEWG